MAFDWTEEAVATLVKRYADGKSKTVIALELGCTRNAVVGKVYRLGLVRGSHPPSMDMERIQKLAEKRKHDIAASEHKRKLKEAREAASREIVRARIAEREQRQDDRALKKNSSPLVVVSQGPAIAPETVRKLENLILVPTDHVKPWLSRGARECAFPVGNTRNPADQQSCCRPTLLGKSYCPEHFRVMFTPPAKKTGPSKPITPTRMHFG